MMQAKFKKSICLTVAALIGMIFLSPLAAIACDNSSDAAKKPATVKIATIKQEKVKNSFCAVFTDQQVKAKEKLADGAGKIEIKRAQNLIDLNKKRLDRDVKLAEKKMLLEEKIVKNFSKLEKRASTTVEKEALAAYKAAVTKAISDRREAIKTAIDAYRAGMDKAMADRKAAINQATKNYNDAVKAAYEKAKTDCASGQDEKTIKDTLKKALAVAHEKLVKERQGVEKLKIDIKPLLAARQTAIAKANTDFKAALEKAKTEFKTALGKK
ncbi:MAG: hypothetical protein PHE24_05015 [Patescibacteria group bacterium]|nr:hypothetical protein [Patescibacteria group bacterium]